MNLVPVALEKNIRLAVADKIFTGFHAVEENIRSFVSKSNEISLELFYSKPGPRVKKIISSAKATGIPCNEVSETELNHLVSSLNDSAKDHRGIVLRVSGISIKENIVSLDLWLKTVAEKSTVVILDSVTDPHNVGAIIRSCDQLGADLVILPERRGVKDAASNEVVARTSAGASSWVPIAQVANLNRALELLKNAGFWIYGADAEGKNTTQIKFPNRTALLLGSEGNGISRLLLQNCDDVVSIPTCGRLDSLNVSVAAGILLYEVRRQKLS